MNRVLLLLFLLPLAAWAEDPREKLDPSDPTFGAVLETCLQTQGPLCLAAADDTKPGAESRVLWKLAAESAQVNPELFDMIDDFSAVQGLSIAQAQAQQLELAPMAQCDAASKLGQTGDELVSACAPLYELMITGCFFGLGGDCATLASGIAAGEVLAASPSSAYAWGIDACSEGHRATCDIFGANPFPAGRGYNQRHLVLPSVGLNSTFSDTVGEKGVRGDGPRSLAFDPDLLTELAPQGAGFALEAWIRMAHDLYADREAGREVDREAPILVWTKERCDAGEGLYCKLLGDTGLISHPGSSLGVGQFMAVESACVYAGLKGVDRPVQDGATEPGDYISCGLADQVGERGTLVPPLFDDHSSVLRLAAETAQMSRRRNAGSSSSSSSSTSPPTASTSTTSTPSRRSSKFGLSGYIGFGGIRSWSQKTQASGFNVGVRPRIGPVAFDVEWNWMSDRRWKAVNRTYERQALQFRVHPGIPLIAGLRLRIGGGGQFGSWRGVDGEGPTLGGGANEIIELNYGFSGKATVWLAARIEQQQWFGDVRGQNIDHVTVASFLIGGGL